MVVRKEITAPINSTEAREAAIKVLPRRNRAESGLRLGRIEGTGSLAELAVTTKSTAVPRVSSSYATKIRDLPPLTYTSVFSSITIRPRKQMFIRQCRAIPAKMGKSDQMSVVFYITYHLPVGGLPNGRSRTE